MKNLEVLAAFSIDTAGKVAVECFIWPMDNLGHDGGTEPIVFLLAGNIG